MRLYLNGGDIKQLVIGDVDTGILEATQTAPEYHLRTLVDFLTRYNQKTENITEIHLILNGPSATALRSIITIVNTFALVHKWQLFGYEDSSNDDKIILDRIKSNSMQAVQSGKMLTPIYQNDPKITISNKDQLMRKK